MPMVAPTSLPSRKATAAKEMFYPLALEKAEISVHRRVQME